MRGISNALNYWRHLASSKVLLGGLFAVGLLAAGGTLMYQQSADPASAAQCKGKRFHIVACGFQNRADLKQKWNNNQQGMRGIYRHYDANGRQAANQGVWGRVNKQGTIRVDGEIVATNATTVYRTGHGLKGQTLRDTLNFYGKDSARILVVFENDRFAYGILKDCGNPVTANPKSPVRVCNPANNRVITVPRHRRDDYPGPNSRQCQPKQVCNPRTGEIITVPAHRKDNFPGKNSRKCDNVRVCNPKTGKIINVPWRKRGDYVQKNSRLCNPVRVCNPQTGEIITVKRANADKYVNKDSRKCGNVRVCNPETGKIISVPYQRKDDYVGKNSRLCKPVQVCNPETGETITVKRAKADNYKPKGSEACQPEPQQPEPTPQPVYECTALNVIRTDETDNDGQRSYQFEVSYEVENGATLQNAEFDFGNGETETVEASEGNTITSQEVTYTEAGDYTVEATLHFTVNGETKTLADEDCQASITVGEAPTPPEQPEPQPEQPKEEAPEEIPATGPASILAGLMGAGSLAYGGHAWVQSRRKLGSAFKR